MQTDKKVYQLAYRSILVAAALVLSWVESQFSAFIPVPGMKLGLTNLVVLIALYKISTKDALILNVVRIVLAGVLFGNLFSICYSLAGGMLSWAVMALVKRKNWFGMVGVSLLGGITHNMGQILLAMILLETRQIAYYLPFLWAGGIVAGIVIGIIGGELVRRLPGTNIVTES